MHETDKMQAKIMNKDIRTGDEIMLPQDFVSDIAYPYSTFMSFPAAILKSDARRMQAEVVTLKKPNPSSLHNTPPPPQVNYSLGNAA